MKSVSKPLRQPGLFGQFPFDSYTVIVFGFKIPIEAREAVCHSLDTASVKLAKLFPWLAGQVVIQERTTTDSGRYAIVEGSPHLDQGIFRQKDCTSLCPTYAELLEAKAPFSMLDGKILCPHKITGMGEPMSPSDPWPAFVVQANFVPGGLLLCFASQHSTSDLAGMAQIITYLATICRGEELDPVDVEKGNTTEELPLLEGGEDLSSDFHYMRRPSRLVPQQQDTSLQPRPPAPWRYWRLPASKLAELKQEVNAYSTDDALATFYSHRLTAVRITTGRLSKDETVVVGRTVNSRPLIGLSSNYLGHGVARAHARIPAEALANSNRLPEIAASLRASLRVVDGRYVRSLLTTLHNEKDKTTMFYATTSRPEIDIGFTSWAKFQLCHLDFGGLLGVPDFVRRPHLFERQGLSYIMPRTREGDIIIGCSLSSQDVEALKRDEAWLKVAEYIG